LLLAFKANPDRWVVPFGTYDYVSPVVLAAHFGNADALRLLLICKADVTPHFKPVRAVWAAVTTGRVHALQLLLQAKASAILPDDDTPGWSPLFAAAATGRVKVVRLLLEWAPELFLAKSDEPTECDGRILPAGLTPLDAARLHRRRGTVRELVQFAQRQGLPF
jgi:hypothetical protein